jgi:hypothetical protein
MRFPRADFGPVLFNAFLRLAANCLSVAILYIQRSFGGFMRFHIAGPAVALSTTFSVYKVAGSAMDVTPGCQLPSSNGGILSASFCSERLHRPDPRQGEPMLAC